MKASVLALVVSASMLWTGTGFADEPPVLPAICPAPMDHAMGDMDMNMGAAPDEAHQAMAAGMDMMDSMMMAGIGASDIDVAFICGMIPHHWGAIQMAKAELAHGDDPWAKELAQKIIDAQESEIAQMLEWLGKQAP